MTLTFGRARAIAAGSLLLATTALVADGTRFSDFTPLTSSAGPTADESQPITFGNPDFLQRSITSRQVQLAAGIPNSGSFDMITVNETGHDKGRFLFTVFETGQSGVQRHDLANGTADTIWYSPVAGGAVAFDACFWTPWGTLITAEESWASSRRLDQPVRPVVRAEEPDRRARHRRARDPGGSSNAGADFVHQNVIPRVSHEGVQFDSDGNMYFIDELNGGSLYKYTSAAPARSGEGRPCRLLRRRPRPTCCASATAPRPTPSGPTPGCRSPTPPAGPCPAR